MFNVRLNALFILNTKIQHHPDISYMSPIEFRHPVISAKTLSPDDSVILTFVKLSGHLPFWCGD